MYEVDDSAVQDALSALPPEVLASYLELRAALEVAPDDVGAPLSADRPDGMRTEAIGPERNVIVYFGKWADPQGVVVVYGLVF